MPKMKTSRGAAKRFKLTKNGKLKKNKAFGNHILTKKSSKRKRRIRAGGMVSAADKKRLLRLLPGARKFR